VPLQHWLLCRPSSPHPQKSSLVYEYSEEASNPGYGLVNISGSTITPKTDFTLLEAAFKATSDPSGDGGYNATGGASSCPPQSADWNVSNDDLPNIPVAAEAYLKNGAGPGVGLTGAGSQTGAGQNVAGGQSSGTSTTGSGASSASGSAAASSSKAGGASSLQPMDKAPLFLACIIVAFSFVGATLL